MTKDSLEFKAFEDSSLYFNAETLHLNVAKISNTKAITTQKDGTDTIYSQYHQNQGTYTLVGLGVLGIVMLGAIAYEKIFKNK